MACVLLLAGCEHYPRQRADRSPLELEQRYAFITEANEETGRFILSELERADRELPRGRRKDRSIDWAVLTPFADWDFFYVDGAPLIWSANAGQSFQNVVVPNGFVSDLASVPRMFWQILRPAGRHAEAAVVHDYLYWTQSRTRAEADEIFRTALEDSKVNAIAVWMLYRAVRTFGGTAWDENARLRKAGECRFIHKPPALDVSWSEWKRRPGALRCDPQGDPVDD